MLDGIKSEQIDFYWQQIAPFIERALAESDGEYNLGDIFIAVKNRDMQVWVWTELDQIKAVLITEIINFPNKTVCILRLGSGEGIERWIDDETIYRWAKENGCEGMRIWGRKGWGRALPEEWCEGCVEYRREL